MKPGFHSYPERLAAPLRVHAGGGRWPGRYCSPATPTKSPQPHLQAGLRTTTVAMSGGVSGEREIRGRATSGRASPLWQYSHSGVPSTLVTAGNFPRPRARQGLHHSKTRAS